MPAPAASASRLGGSSAASISRQASRHRRGVLLGSDGWSGVQRLQGRKPARSASAQVAWNRTFSGRGRRAAQDGRQYTPVVLTE